MNLTDLKKKYNYWIRRNKNAEHFFSTKPIEECIKHLNLFNQITIELSDLRNELEKELNRKMTRQEILNGF